MHLRGKKNRGDVSLQEPIGVDKEGNEITLFDVLGTHPEAVVDEVELEIAQEKLYKIIEKLDSRDKKVLEMRFGIPHGERKTQREIATQLGISRSYVSRIEKKVISKLAEEFNVPPENY